MKKIKRYIPTKVYEFIESSSYKNKDHLYIVCDMINRISIYRKENDDYTNHFRDIPKVYFSNIITNKKYMYEAFDFLQSNMIILCDNVYSKNEGKALGYKFNESFISQLQEVQIDSFTLSRKIITNINDSNKIVAKQFNSYKDYFLKNFKIDYNAAIEWLDKWFISEISSLEFENTNDYIKKWIKVVNKYNSLFISLCAIRDKELFFKKNATNGRIDTNLTSLKKDFKQFIEIKDLVQIDIVNSQPYFLSTILNSLLCSINPIESLMVTEIQQFKKCCCEGNLYENFQSKIYRKTGKMIERAKIKEILFCIFYSKNGSYKKEKMIFKEVYPNILALIEKQKEKNHNHFSIKLQKIESEICIDTILPILDKNKINYLTIHDSWLVNKSDLEKSLVIINECFMQRFGFVPQLKIEDIKSQKNTFEF